MINAILAPPALRRGKFSYLGILPGFITILVLLLAPFALPAKIPSPSLPDEDEAKIS